MQQISDGSVAVDSSPDNPAPIGRPVSRWAIHRRLYDWVLGFARGRNASLALFVLSFAESSLFPIPPDVLLMPMCLAKRRRSFYFATLCTSASVLGGIAGYAIGWGLWQALSDFFFTYVPGFTPEQFARVQDWYATYDFWIVFIAALTPIPYKLFTIAGGVFGIALPMFVVASIVGRGMRFFAIAGLMWLFGEKIVKFVDRYFNLLSIVFTVLLIGGFALVKWVR